MKTMNPFKSILTISLLAITAGICTGQQKPADELAGVWTKTVQGRTATLAIAADQTFTVEFAGDDQVDVWGSYAVSGGQIALTDKGGAYSSGSTGTYSFSISGREITLTVVDDPVQGRSMLVTGTWTRTPGEAPTE